MIDADVRTLVLREYKSRRKEPRQLTFIAVVHLCVDEHEGLLRSIDRTNPFPCLSLSQLLSELQMRYDYIH